MSLGGHFFFSLNLDFLEGSRTKITGIFGTDRNYFSNIGGARCGSLSLPQSELLKLPPVGFANLPVDDFSDGDRGKKVCFKNLKTSAAWKADC